jgi:hypothetical protein
MVGDKERECAGAGSSRGNAERQPGTYRGIGCNHISSGESQCSQNAIARTADEIRSEQDMLI